MAEMMRVTKKGGAVYFIVPTFVQSICAFPHLYMYIARRALEVVSAKVLRRPVVRKTLLPKLDDSSRSASKIAGSFRANHPSFPLPEPHGSYKNIFEEFAYQMPWNWAHLPKRCGAVSTESFGCLFLPFNILEVFSTNLVAFLFSQTKTLHSVLGRSILKYFSYAFCVVAKK